MIEFANLIEPVSRRLLGEPNATLSSANELRFGTRGSIKINVAGAHAGYWHDFEADAGGGVLDLIRRARGGTREDALRWLGGEFGDAGGRPECTIAAVSSRPSRIATRAASALLKWSGSNRKISGNGGRTVTATGFGVSKASARCLIDCPSCSNMPGGRAGVSSSRARRTPWHFLASARPRLVTPAARASGAMRLTRSSPAPTSSSCRITTTRARSCREAVARALRGTAARIRVLACLAWAGRAMSSTGLRPAAP